MTGVRWSDDDLKAYLARASSNAPPVVPATPGAATAPLRLVEAREKRAHNRPEEDIQKQVAEYLDLALPPDLRWWHTPNQRGTRKKWEVALLKALGVKPGVQDITIVGRGPRVIIIEMKSGAGSLNKAQKDWRDFYRSVGIPWFLCRSLEDVIAALEDCGVRLRAR